MKTLLLFSAVLLAATAGAAETTNRAPVKAQAAPPAAGTFQTQPSATNQPPMALKRLKPNEIAVGKATLSGIAVQAKKAKNPLQLLNPRAPARYGAGQDNLVRYNFSGTGPMLKFLSLDF